MMVIRNAFRHADPKTFYHAKNQEELVQCYDVAARVYDEAMTSDVGWCGHIELAKVVGRLVKKDAKLLDAGAGTGMLGSELKNLGFSNMDANDISPGMLDEAIRKRIYHDCRVLELGSPLSYSSNSYDAVTVCGVFTPNHAPANALYEIVRVTREKGLVLFTLRADETPPHFPQIQQELSDSGAWVLVEATEPFPSIASEPHIQHKCWVYKVN